MCGRNFCQDPAEVVTAPEGGVFAGGAVDGVVFVQTNSTSICERNFCQVPAEVVTAQEGVLCLQGSPSMASLACTQIPFECVDAFVCQELEEIVARSDGLMLADIGLPALVSCNLDAILARIWLKF